MKKRQMLKVGDRVMVARPSRAVGVRRGMVGTVAYSFPRGSKHGSGWTAARPARCGTSRPASCGAWRNDHQPGPLSGIGVLPGPGNGRNPVNKRRNA